jgi:alkylation response protein AidB-like acyl-CoA dehydrogenase
MTREDGDVESEEALRSLEELSAYADQANDDTSWPTQSLALAQQAGALRWSIPQAWGGLGLESSALFDRHEVIASCCLTTSFILSQREASIRQLRKGPEPLQRAFLPKLATGQCFSTVGISHLTTSRQHQAPAVRVRAVAGGYRWTGEIPWVTGGDQADFLVAGGTLEDGRQVLAVIPTDRPGFSVHAPMRLASLVGSRTSAVALDDVAIEEDLIIVGPMEKALGTVGGGGLDTSNLGLGLARSAILFMADEARRRPAIMKVLEPLEQQYQLARQRLREEGSSTDPSLIYNLRVDASLLALRATQAALLIAKGAGFVVPHPAQRWARQAHFFLVWSCPGPVSDGLLQQIVVG